LIPFLALIVINTHSKTRGRKLVTSIWRIFWMFLWSKIQTRAKAQKWKQEIETKKMGSIK
jgi:hypothetical protein